MRRSCCTVGKFEAFHRGHRKLIEKAKELCSSVKAVSIRGKGEGIFTEEEREEIARSLGVELINVPFEEIRELSPKEFLKLLKEMGCSVLIVGEDWRFGKGRAGNVKTARELGERIGLEVVTVPVEREGEEKIGASRILKLLREGEVEKANSLLGFNYFTVGIVERGISKGREMGFPTVNVKPFKPLPIPFGVYAVKLKLNGEELRGIANYGRAPTVKGGKPTVEVFIPGVELPPLYGKRVRVEFLKFLRPERKFPSVEELINQIKLDLKKLEEFWRKGVGTEEGI